MALFGPNLDSGLPGALRKPLHEHWRLFMAEGVFLSILGLAAMLLPFLAGIATTIFLGWLFVMAGVVGLLFTVRAKGMPGFAWSLLSAIAALVAGGLLVWNPLRGLMTLTYVLVAFFIIDGVAIILLALEHRRELSRRWEWMLLNGIIDLLLAAIVISGMPGSFVWALGLLVGIDMLFGGFSLVAMARDARNDAAA
jgi:uncharacterized membrane protein HdeD (DUF308 family)